MGLWFTGRSIVCLGLWFTCRGIVCLGLWFTRRGIDCLGLWFTRRGIVCLELLLVVTCFRAHEWLDCLWRGKLTVLILVLLVYVEEWEANANV